MIFQFMFTSHSYLSIYIYIFDKEGKSFVIVFNVVVNNGNESDNIEKKWKNNVIQIEEFNVKESQRYNVSGLMNHHQDWY